MHACIYTSFGLGPFRTSAVGARRRAHQGREEHLVRCGTSGSDFEPVWVCKNANSIELSCPNALPKVAQGGTTLIRTLQPHVAALQQPTSNRHTPNPFSLASAGSPTQSTKPIPIRPIHPAHTKDVPRPALAADKRPVLDRACMGRRLRVVSAEFEATATKKKGNEASVPALRARLGATNAPHHGPAPNPHGPRRSIQGGVGPSNALATSLWVECRGWPGSLGRPMPRRPRGHQHHNSSFVWRWMTPSMYVYTVVPASDKVPTPHQHKHPQGGIDGPGRQGGEATRRFQPSLRARLPIDDFPFGSAGVG